MEKDKVKVDIYGCLTIPTPARNNSDSNFEASDTVSLSFVYPSDNVPLKCTVKEAAVSTHIRDIFFTLNCVKNEDETRSLILNGKDLQLKLGLIQHYLHYST